MAFCIECGEKIVDGAKFCPICGASQAGTTHNNQRRIVYEGEIHKCPNCGEMLPSFAAVCTSCGYEVRGSRASDSVNSFASRLGQLQSDADKCNYIRSFPIPNNKEDIYEFLIIASTNIGDELAPDISKAWAAKAKQCYQKAKMVFKNDTDFADIQNTYNEVCAKIGKVRQKENIKNMGTVISELTPIMPQFIVSFLWLVSLFVLLPLCRINLDHVGTNGYQIFMMLDIIAGAIFIPFLLKSDVALPKIVITLGLALTIIVLIPLCKKGVDSSSGASAFQIILFTDIICSVVILVRVLKQKNRSSNKAPASSSFIVAMVSTVILIIIYGVGSVFASRSEADTNRANEIEYEQKHSVTYNLPSSGLSRYLPSLPSIYGKIVTDDDSRFNIDLFKVTQEQFEDFVSECKEKGFSISITKTDSTFYAYHEDEFELNLFYSDDEQTLSLFLDAPLPMAEIKFPDNDLIRQIPLPKSSVGNIYNDSSEQFTVYIANTTPEQYAEYVDACIDKGFTIDYSRGDDYFYGYNWAGYYIRVEQELFNKIYIDIKAPGTDEF